MTNVSSSGFTQAMCWTTLCCVLLVSVLVVPTTHAQFFTKTSKSVPRMGRRSEPPRYTAQPDQHGLLGLGSSSNNGGALGEALRLVRLYDNDGDGSLSVDELVPLVAMADSPDLLRRVHELLDASNGNRAETEWSDNRR